LTLDKVNISFFEVVVTIDVDLKGVDAYVLHSQYFFGVSKSQYQRANDIIQARWY
jgi:hypothetical protein